MTAALFALPQGGTTDVVEGEDGIFRIGRVTEIRTEVVDEQLTQELQSAGVELAAYRAAIRAGLLRQAMEEKLIAQLTAGPVEQVHPYRILLRADPSDPSANDAEVRAAHILYAPKDDTSGTDAVPSDDPAWDAAEQEARKAVDRLPEVAARNKLFAEIAAAESDAEGSKTDGGELGWFSRATMVRPFADAVFEGEHTDGEVIGPVLTQYGWHVILFEGRRQGARDRIEAIKAEAEKPGADFVAIAKRESEGADAGSGGDMGWLVRYQTEQLVELVLFSLQAGQLSAIQLESDGYVLYYVGERQTREVDDDQLTTLRQSAFQNWYTPRKQAVAVWRDPVFAAPADQGF